MIKFHIYLLFLRISCLLVHKWFSIDDISNNYIHRFWSYGSLVVLLIVSIVTLCWKAPIYFQTKDPDVLLSSRGLSMHPLPIQRVFPEFFFLFSLLPTPRYLLLWICRECKFWDSGYDNAAWLSLSVWLEKCNNLESSKIHVMNEY